MPAAAMPVEQAVVAPKVTQKEHWFVEVVGGFTIATTIVSGMALLYTFFQYGLPNA